MAFNQRNSHKYKKIHSNLYAIRCVIKVCTNFFNILFVYNLYCVNKSWIKANAKKKKNSESLRGTKYYNTVIQYNSENRHSSSIAPCSIFFNGINDILEAWFIKQTSFLRFKVFVTIFLYFFNIKNATNYCKIK